MATVLREGDLVAVNKLESGLILLEVGKEAQVPAGQAVIVEIEIHLSSETKRVDIICALVGQEKPTLVTLSSRSTNLTGWYHPTRTSVTSLRANKSQRARRSILSLTNTTPTPASELRQPDRSEPTLAMQTSPM